MRRLVRKSSEDGRAADTSRLGFASGSCFLRPHLLAGFFAGSFASDCRSSRVFLDLRMRSMMENVSLGVRLDILGDKTNVQWSYTEVGR